MCIFSVLLGQAGAHVEVSLGTGSWRVKDPTHPARDQKAPLLLSQVVALPGPLWLSAASAIDNGSWREIGLCQVSSSLTAQ